jgi:hypothetical protein
MHLSSWKSANMSIAALNERNVGTPFIIGKNETHLIIEPFDPAKIRT